MANPSEIPPFPNPGVRLIKEDDHIAIWEEVFEPGKPTAPHRHTRDYIACFPNGGELTILPVLDQAEPEEVTIAAGQLKQTQTESGGIRLSLSDGTTLYQRIPADGSCHFAVNEGSKPALMILIEIKGSGQNQRTKL